MLDAYRPIEAVAAAALAIAAFAAAPAEARWAGAALGGLLAWAAIVDARLLILPDPLTVLIALVGLLVAALEGRQALLASAIGAAVGYGAFAALSWGYRRLRGRDGMGLGDAKLFAGAGAWVGWQGLPLISLLAAMTGIAQVALLALRGRAGRDMPIAFGPHLCAATWLVWRFGRDWLL